MRLILLILLILIFLILLLLVLLLLILLRLLLALLFEQLLQLFQLLIIRIIFQPGFNRLFCPGDVVGKIELRAAVEKIIGGRKTALERAAMTRAAD